MSFCKFHSNLKFTRPSGEVVREHEHHFRRKKKNRPINKKYNHYLDFSLVEKYKFSLLFYHSYYLLF